MVVYTVYYIVFFFSPVQCTQGEGGRGCGSLSPGGGGNCAHSWRSSPASAFFFLGMVGGNGGPLLSNEGHARKRERIRRKEEGQ